MDTAWISIKAIQWLSLSSCSDSCISGLFWKWHWTIYLGIIVSNDLKPSKQCSRAANKANSISGFIQRCFKWLDKQGLSILYKGLGRPHIDYLGSVWSPYYTKDVDTLEKVQRKATRLVSGLCNLSYKEQLLKLGCQLLEVRRAW